MSARIIVLYRWAPRAPCSTGATAGNFELFDGRLIAAHAGSVAGWAAAFATRGSEAICGTKPLLRNKEKARKTSAGLSLYGSPRRTRTADPVINSHLLYRLSYRGIA